MNPTKARLTNIILIIFLTIYYVAVFSRFGQKFAAAVALSLATGAVFIALRTLLARLRGHDSPTPFPWLLYAAFPLFYPLPLSLWLLPLILVVAHLMAVSAFGGHPNHSFNPVAVAAVFMLLGYGHTASIGPSLPMPAATGFTSWSAGVPSTQPPAKIYRQIPAFSALKASITPAYPSIPGASMGGYLLAMAIFLAFYLKRGRPWLLATLVFMSLLPNFSSLWKGAGMVFPYALFFGPLPALAFIYICDEALERVPALEQVVGALIFVAFFIFTSVRSQDIYHLIYAFLLMQTLAPLATDLLGLLKLKRGTES